jgi:hypothetical protein
MRIDERLPRIAGATTAAALLFVYAVTPWHTTTAGLVTILAVNLLLLGTGEYVSFRLRRQRRNNQALTSGNG